MNTVMKFVFFKLTFPMSMMLISSFNIMNAGSLPTSQKVINNISKSVEDESIYDLILGSKSSPISIEEYTSLSCYACKNFSESIFPHIKSEFIDTGKIKYRIIEFISSIQDKEATALSRYVFNKFGEDAYMKIKKELLSNQEKWAYSENYKDYLVELAIQHGVSESEYLKCVENSEIVDKGLLSRNIDSIQENHINATPALRLNGEVVKQMEIVQKIKDALNKHKDIYSAFAPK